MTGGGGYLGCKLCRELTRRGYSVTAFDLNFLEEELESGVTHIQVGNAVQCSHLLYIMRSCCMYNNVAGEK